MTIRRLVCVGLLMTIAVNVGGAERRESVFDSVGFGPLIIYDIGGLTDGKQDIADEILKYVRDNSGLDRWKGRVREAAGRATPTQLTIKASPNVHEKVVDLLRSISHRLYIWVEYELVSATYTGNENPDTVLINDPRNHPDFTLTSRIVHTSQMKFEDGDVATLIEGDEALLPTVRLRMTVSPDRQIMYVQQSLQNPPAGKNPARRIPVARSTAFRFPDSPPDQWLIVRASLLERHYVPAGTAALISGR